MALVNDQDVVEEFPAHVPTKRSAIALARGARAGVGMILTSRAVKAASTAAGELGVVVADEESEAPPGVLKIHAEVAGQAGRPGACGVGGDAQEVHLAGGVLDGEEHVEPVQGEGVEMKQVAGEDRVCLGPQKLRPG
jgi:hypothetical protein